MGWTIRILGVALLLGLGACATQSTREPVPAATPERAEQPSAAPTQASAQDARAVEREQAEQEAKAKAASEAEAARAEQAREASEASRQAAEAAAAGKEAAMAAEQASRTAEAERLGRSAEARKAAEAARIANASAIEAEQNKQANAANEAVKTTATDKAAGNLTIRGSLKLLAGAGQQVRPGEVSEAVVYFLPAAGATRPKPGHYVMATKDKQFKPHLLVVPIGSTVSFTNEDPILHNVFSATPRSPFDLGVYGPGDVRDAHFDHAGLVQVSCNVHHSMRANVLVMETPYYTRPDATGLFELDNLPPGKGTLVFWHPRAAPQTLAVDGPITGLVSRKLTAVRAPIVGS